MTDAVYTKDTVASMVEAYKAVVAEAYDIRTEVVADLAKNLGKSVPSVRSMLVREGVYVPKETVKSSATKSKEEYVKALEAISGEALPSFTKATKKDLEAFWGYIVKATDRHDANQA